MLNPTSPARLSTLLILPDASQQAKAAKAAVVVALLGMILIPMMADASTSGDEFQSAYQWIYDAATGYLGRAIAITGGVIGLGVGAATGKATPAIVGIVLGIFGSLGPSIVDSIFNSAVV
jgi:conjugal transfer pilus assembly protein TraA